MGPGVGPAPSSPPDRGNSSMHGISGRYRGSSRTDFRAAADVGRVNSAFGVEQRIRLDLGAGEISPPGFVALGHDHGSEIFPLPYGDGTVDQIRASHVLEQIGRAHV